MNVRSIRFSTKTHRPEQITVRMSVDEAAVIAKTFGGFSPKSFAEKFPGMDEHTSGEIYDCLVGEFFNRYWDDGVDGALRGDDE